MVERGTGSRLFAAIEKILGEGGAPLRQHHLSSASQPIDTGADKPCRSLRDDLAQRALRPFQGIGHVVGSRGPGPATEWNI